jgi:hypothetical protein
MHFIVAVPHIKRVTAYAVKLSIKHSEERLKPRLQGELAV